jgi:hypothetical protein
MVSDVQGWLNNPSSNSGWLLLGNESTTLTSKRFDTKENTTASLRPKLAVTYSTTGVGGDQTVPLVFALHQNYPNPFNPSTTIEFALPASERVVLKVFDILGQEVAELLNEVRTRGRHAYSFNAKDLASGIYVYRLQAGSFASARKMIVMK